jgi:PAS domain S-box-containing protein
LLSKLAVILDDSSTNLKIFRRLTESLGDGVAAETFAERAAALSFCAAKVPDLLILAAASEMGEAAELLGELRRLPGLASVPAIVVGAEEDSAAIERTMAAGADDYLFMPVNRTDFRLRIGRQLHRRRRPERGDAAASETAVDGGRADAQGLRQAHETLLRIVDIIPRMICVTDKEGRYLLVNRQFASFVGVRASRLIGRRPLETHDSPLARSLAASDARLLAGKIAPISSEEEVADSDGNPCVLLAHKAVFHGDDDEESMVVTVLLDITDRKRAEREVLAAKEEAELANRTMGEFIANMSHELRTPLNAILGFSQVIAGEMLGPIGTPKYIGYARDVIASAEHLLGIINDILDVSKLEAGRLDLAEEVLDPARAIAEIVQLAEAKARAGDIAVAIRGEAHIPALRADGRKLKQIVLNLLMNAIKFSHPGGEVEIVLGQRDGAVAISVIDHGIGMDAAELETAMSRFGQVASAWTRRHDGTGLGLPLAIGLTELHGGTLTIRSSKGIGTTVTVTFPRERSEPSDEPVGVPDAGELRAVGGP